MWPAVSPTKIVPGALPPSTKGNTVILDHRPLLSSPTAHSFSHLHSEVNDWSDLCERVSKAQDYTELSVANIMDESERLALALLVAMKVGNRTLLSQLGSAVALKQYRTGDEVNVQQLTLACLKACVLSGQEDLACGCVELFQTELPLYLVHRAGEQGMLRFLYALYRFQVSIRTNAVIASMPSRVRSLLKRKETAPFQRFPAKYDFLTEADLIHWAAISRNSHLILGFLQESPNLLSADLVEALLAEGLGGVLEEAIAVTDIDDFPILPILNHGEIGLAVRLVDNSKRCLSMKTPKSIRSYKVVLKLISMVSHPEAGISALYLLSLIERFEWNEPEVVSLLGTLQEVLTEEVEASAVVCCGNALLYCVAATELCVQVAPYSLHHQDHFVRLSAYFLTLAERIQGKYTDYRKLKVLYMERAYGSLCLFDVITGQTDRYRGLLKSDIVAAVVQDLWTGGNSECFNFSHFCAANQYFDGWNGGLFALHPQYLSTSLPKSLFQLYYWKQNGSLRLLVETAMLIGLCGILISQVRLYVQLMEVVEDPELMTGVNVNEFLNEQMDIQIYLTRVILANAAALILNVIQIYTYKALLKERNVGSFTDILSVVFFLATLAANILADPSVSSRMDPDLSRNTQEGVYAVMVFTVCLRMSAILTQTRTFGPWIRMIFIITKDIAVFLLLYLLAVLAFTLTYVVLFRREKEYFGSIEKGLRTLFQWSVAGVDSTVFTEKEELGSILALAWAFVSAIILLNLLIAVLSSRFEALSPLVTADYVSLMYKSYSQTRYEPPFGALVVAPAPFNILTIWLVPIYVTWPATAKHLDPLFVVLSYQVWFVIGSALFAIYCVLASVVAYCYVSVQLARATKVRRKCELLPWLLISPFYLALLSLLSCFRFAKEMYRSQAEVVTGVPPEVLTPSLRFLTILSRNSQANCWISLKDVESALAHFPRSKQPFPTNASHRKLFVKRSSPFKEVADRIYFSKAQLADERSKSIILFFQQFASYCEKGEMQRIDVHRMKRLITKYRKTPEKLAAFSISAVQAALLSCTN